MTDFRLTELGLEVPPKRGGASELGVGASEMGVVSESGSSIILTSGTGGERIGMGGADVGVAGVGGSSCIVSCSELVLRFGLGDQLGAWSVGLNSDLK